MAGGTERILRGRVKAMQSTKKITRAMELIAGSRIVKAQQRVQAAVPYSEQITEVVNPYLKNNFFSKIRPYCACSLALPAPP